MIKLKFMSIKELLLKIKDSAKIFFLPCEENEFRARIFAGNFLISFFLLAVFLKLAFAFFVYSFSSSSFYADITKTSLVELTNKERIKNNLPALNQNPLLDAAAYMKATDMANNGYFSHNSPAGMNPWYWFDRSGYNYKYAGENLAIGFLESNEVNDAWIASPTHKANIVNGKYKDIGIAILKTNFHGNPATIVVQLFGSRQVKAAVQPTAATVAAPNANKNITTTESAGKEVKEVLGAATTAPDKDSATFKMIAFFAEKYFGLVQYLIYVSMGLVALLLGINFAMKADFEHVDLIAKAFGFIVIMAVFAMIDQSLVVALVPHNLKIY